MRECRVCIDDDDCIIIGNQQECRVLIFMFVYVCFAAAKLLTLRFTLKL